ncbi:hypothetical protein NCAS_0A07700 [Naumovozyma castellii]|uniref:RRM domain-containing protein n=1 Tax=Naumovozyma castellii TaxID=27288 RepID=G0V780_NAUCA|nr:hypothetical protein NCAS_0A07700 [Naumovozyma castellii CBS 4309]CCC67328.1 hypothetical protein NCAS_0A07700 [Naumovozyma castellii CBS 4309]
MVEASNKLGDVPIHFATTEEEKKSRQHEIDSRSVFIKGLHQDITPNEIESYFNTIGCGDAILRITVFDERRKKGRKNKNVTLCAYVEFQSLESHTRALELNECVFDGGMLRVFKKRTNLPASKRHNG